MPVTRFGLEGYGVRRAGSFSGKTLEGSHPVGKITRFGLEGYGVRRAGSFSRSGTIVGTLDATEGADTAALTGTVLVSGTLSGTEGADTAAFTGTVLVSGTLAATEGADSAEFTGTISTPAVPSSSDGKRRRRRTGDEELTEAEVQYMQRKLRELKQAKTKREEDAARKALEIAFAQAAQDDEAARAIEAAANGNYAALMRNDVLLARVTDKLAAIARQHAEDQDEDDVETLLLLI